MKMEVGRKKGIKNEKEMQKQGEFDQKHIINIYEL